MSNSPHNVPRVKDKKKPSKVLFSIDKNPGTLNSEVEDLVWQNLGKSNTETLSLFSLEEEEKKLKNIFTDFSKISVKELKSDRYNLQVPVKESLYLSPKLFNWTNEELAGVDFDFKPNTIDTTEKLMTSSQLQGALLEKEYEVKIPESVTQRKKKLRAQRSKTMGPKWYGLGTPELTTEMKQDMEVLRLRGFIDPKKFFKKGNRKLPEYFEVATLKTGAQEYYSEKKNLKKKPVGFTNALIEDQNYRKYAKRKFKEIQDKNTGKRFKKKRKIEKQ